MARTIAAEWNVVDHETKERYERIARQEMDRYKIKLSQWRKLAKLQQPSNAHTPGKKQKIQTQASIVSPPTRNEYQENLEEHNWCITNDEPFATETGLFPSNFVMPNNSPDLIQPSPSETGTEQDTEPLSWRWTTAPGDTISTTLMPSTVCTDRGSPSTSFERSAFTTTAKKEDPNCNNNNSHGTAGCQSWLSSQHLPLSAFPEGSLGRLMMKPSTIPHDSTNSGSSGTPEFARLTIGIDRLAKQIGPESVEFFVNLFLDKQSRPAHTDFLDQGEKTAGLMIPTHRSD